jgi:hypothetical protein
MKGMGFCPSVDRLKMIGLQPLRDCIRTATVPSGAEALVYFALFAARLKSCLVTMPLRQRLYPQPVKREPSFRLALFTRLS